MEESSTSQSPQTSPSDETVETRTLRDLFLKEGSQEAKCRIWDQILKTTQGATTGLHVHLRTKHKIFIKKRTELGDKNTENSDLTPRSKQRKISEGLPTQDDKSMEAVLSRLTALDGLPFAVFTTSLDLRDLLTNGGYLDVPKTPQIIRNTVIQHTVKIRGHVISEIRKLENLGKKFSITFDEWTSKRNRRLVRIHGGAPAEKCLDLVSGRLKEFGLSLNTDIICICTDGASVMTKVGNISPTLQQMCFAHAIQLGVMDVLYSKPKPTNEKRSDINIDIPDVDEDEGLDMDLLTVELEVCEADEDTPKDLVDQFRSIIDKVRRVVKIFRKSPKKNDEVLQKHTLVDIGKELQLQLDSRTRWSSLFDMIKRFVTLKVSILKSLIDIDSEMSFSEQEWATLSSLASVLEPVKLTVEALCRRDTNLHTADAMLQFMITKLENQNSTMSTELVTVLTRRIKQRRTNFSGILNIRDLIQRLHAIGHDDSPDEDDEDPLSNLTSQRIKHNQKTALEIELQEAIQKAISSAHSEKSQVKQNLLSTIKKELALFQHGGTRGVHLQIVYDSLLTIRPTSVEAERAFSSAGILAQSGMLKNMCRKVWPEKHSVVALCLLWVYVGVAEERREFNPVIFVSAVDTRLAGVFKVAVASEERENSEQIINLWNAILHLSPKTSKYPVTSALLRETYPNLDLHLAPVRVVYKADKFFGTMARRNEREQGTDDTLPEVETSTRNGSLSLTTKKKVAELEDMSESDAESGPQDDPEVQDARGSVPTPSNPGVLLFVTDPNVSIRMNPPLFPSDPDACRGPPTEGRKKPEKTDDLRGAAHKLRNEKIAIFETPPPLPSFNQ
ncbi:hypothetical protein Fcan01_11805 [Folsomia candida]|uniref:HAT C-terminal dimerisation domain-containing protein n=1 Tax=Folsomia candida TaxID=158441 RepID=A0A226EBE0_FOLCA|nr:hypothetical protein Fcan01_11805 [Folsomia candida]